MGTRFEEIEPGFFAQNRARLAALLPEKAVAIVHSNDVMPTNGDGTMPFCQNSDLYYLSGIRQEDTALILCPSSKNPRLREVLFIRESSEELVIWEGRKLSQEEAGNISGVTELRWAKELEDVLENLMPEVKEVFFLENEHARATTPVETRNERFGRQWQARFPTHQYQRLAPLMAELRMVKDRVEVEQIQKAVEITEAGFRRALAFVKPGVGEWEVEAEYLHEFVRRGSKGFAYAPILASGENACVLHYIENDQPCAEGDLLLMDVGAEWMGWNADMTRTIPVNGKFSKRQKQVYKAVLRVMRRANQLLRPGVLLKDYQQSVLEVMAEELRELGLLTKEEAANPDGEFSAVKRYFMHGTSHHLGLEVHDVNRPERAIEAGMVLTIEPGIYIREEKLGVRLENNVVIGEKVNRDLFKNVPIEAEEIEELMAKL